MGKTALITGASRGIGAAIALRLAKDGYDIWINYRSRENEAEAVRDSILKLGREVRLLKFDVCSESDTERVLAPLLEGEYPEVLVNNAGVARDNVVSFMTSEEWDSVIDTSLKGFFLVTRLVVTKMIRAKKGRIVNISSTSGETGLPGQVNYSAAKAGLIGATKALAKEVARKGILVNAVAPGLIDTEMTKDLPLEEMLKMVPLKRTGTPDEVAGAVSFLCSADATYITGQVISVNGGLYV
jgi:3-oxoacyl-[acyl-carrier protein] reductase